MKTALIVFKSQGGESINEFYRELTDSLEFCGFGVDTFQSLSRQDDLGFIRSLRELKDTADNLIVLDDGALEFDIKKCIASEFETTPVENENARRFLDAVSKADGVNYGDENAVLPMSATLIPNLTGAYQGFMIDDNEFTLAVLPATQKQCEVMCLKYVVPYLESKYAIKTKRQTLKLNCETQKIEDCIKELKSTFGDVFKYKLTDKNGDKRLDIAFNEREESALDVIRNLISILKDDIYAEFDTSPEERLFDVIKLKNLKLSTAESFTAGRIASRFIKNSGASNHFHEGVVAYSNQSKFDRLGVKKEDLIKDGAVSSVVAYQMALGLLKGGNCDVAIATTGIAGPNSDQTDKPVGLCYVAVGTLKGIHTFKLNLSGTREKITETAVNTALVLAIKILKRI